MEESQKHYAEPKKKKKKPPNTKELYCVISSI